MRQTAWWGWVRSWITKPIQTLSFKEGFTLLDTCCHIQKYKLTQSIRREETCKMYLLTYCKVTSCYRSGISQDIKQLLQNFLFPLVSMSSCMVTAGPVLPMPSLAEDISNILTSKPTLNIISGVQINGSNTLTSIDYSYKSIFTIITFKWLLQHLEFGHISHSNNTYKAKINGSSPIFEHYI